MIFSAEPKPGANKTGEEGDSSSPMDQLSSLVSSLAISSADSEIKPVADSASKLVTSEPTQEEVVKLMYTRCQEDWRFCTVAAKVFKSLADLEGEGGTKFRQTLLRTLQGDFKDKDKLRVDSPQQFLANISMLTQTLCYVRLMDGEPFKPLLTPVMEGIDLCLDNKATDQELECVAEQLMDVGLILSALADKPKLQRLRNNVKDKIAAGQGSVATRLKLINVIEGFASAWQLHAPNLNNSL